MSSDPGFRARVLIVEDNHDIVANLYEYLEPLGYTLDTAANGFAGLALAADRQFDVIVLDLMLPGVDGIELCRRLRKELRSSTPVIMLTARDTVDDKVLGLQAGADDYLVKPFSMAELDARLRALIRRATSQHGASVLQVGELRFDTEAFEVTRRGQPIALTPIGYRLLGVLMRASPRVVTRERLESEVWGDDRPSSDALRTHLHALRQALDKPFDSPMLVTVHAVGYRLLAGDAD